VGGRAIGATVFPTSRISHAATRRPAGARPAAAASSRVAARVAQRRGPRATGGGGRRRRVRRAVPPRLEAYCRAIVRDDEDARDAVQTTMTKALVALRRGRSALRPAGGGAAPSPPRCGRSGTATAARRSRGPGLAQEQRPRETLGQRARFARAGWRRARRPRPVPPPLRRRTPARSAQRARRRRPTTLPRRRPLPAGRSRMTRRSPGASSGRPRLTLTWPNRRSEEGATARRGAPPARPAPKPPTTNSTSPTRSTTIPCGTPAVRARSSPHDARSARMSGST
jgi:hypothetical protein